MPLAKACPPVFAALFACGGASSPGGPAQECTYYEADVTYSVGVSEPAVDGGPVLGVDWACSPLPSGIAAVDATGHVGCSMLVVLPELGDESLCTGSGFELPDTATLRRLLEDRPGAAGQPACFAPQLLGTDLDATGSCSDSPKRGWCYVTGAAAGGCSQTVVTPTRSVVPGGSYVFRCAQGC